MPLVVSDGAIEQYAAEWAAARNSEGLEIRLFQNDHEPGPGDTAGDYTEADFGGYGGGKTLDAWDDAGVVLEAPRAVVPHPDVEWTADGTTANTIYGYYVVDGSGNLRWAERRAAGGVVVDTAGQIYRVSPRFAFRSEFPED